MLFIMLWDNVIGLGVAGNFTGHLEQAGEAGDFVDVKTAEQTAPKGVFPFFVPRGPRATADHFLHQMPISSDVLTLSSASANHQIEPEMALLCDLRYRGGEVVGIEPKWAMAHNDCSIRREGARKISEKKNWGACSKGTASARIPIDRFCAGGVLDRYRLTSFLLRDGVLHPYGIDSPVSGYSYFNERLIAWLIDRLNHQKNEGPLEDLSRWLTLADHPTQALISVGATRYTPFGATHYLQSGDRAIVALYDAQQHNAADLKALIRSGAAGQTPGLSLLDQGVRASTGLG